MGKRKRRFEWLTCPHAPQPGFVALDMDARVTLVRLCRACMRKVRKHVTGKG